MDDATQFGFASRGRQAGRLVPKPSTGSLSRPATEGKVRASFSEQSFAVCVLILSTGAFVSLFPGEQGVEFEEQGLLFAQILWAILFVVMLFIARKQFVEFGRLAWQNKPFVLLLGWACLSVVWSIDQQVTIRHVIALLATSFFGIYLAVRYDLPGRLRLIAISLGVVVTASVAASLVFPQYGIDRTLLEEPAWQGVFSHKNTLGRLTLLAALILVLYLLRRRR